jgi:glycosyltransferase involved in cell wall biosynthesis
MVALTLFIVFTGAVFYAYAGYPLLLALFSRGRKPPASVPDLSDEALPTATLLIAAHDEEATIAEKIENSLRIDYPRPKLRIVVVSDGSTDRTDEIVRRYEQRGISLVRIDPRQGKSLARNRAVEAARGDILVMSDANATYGADALRKLLRHFADPSVGAVCGELRLLRERGSENLYWRYEKWIKRLEDRFHSIIGANGSIYAIRRSLYVPLPAEADDDFLEPLHAYLDGHKLRYEQEALSFERDIKAKNIRREFSAKRRTVLRGIQSLHCLSKTEAPFRDPALAFSLVSHKILKWLAPFFLVGAIVTSAILASHPFFLAVLAIQIFLYGCAIAGIATGRPVFHVPAFFVLTNAAAFAAVIAFLAGNRSITWEKKRS